MRNPTRRNHPGTILPCPEDLKVFIGHQFSRLIVVGYAGRHGPNKRTAMTCICSCGLYVDVWTLHLRSGNTQSCGCQQRDAVTAKNIAARTHGETSDGRWTDLYRAWSNIKGRCHSPTHQAYKYYGARGIALWPAWHDYETFRDDVEAEIGRRPSRSYSLDRIDNNKGYEPGNIRWATSLEQNQNQRNSRFHELGGEIKTLSEWAVLAKIKYETVRQRVYLYKWPLDEALGTPPGAGRCPKEARIKWVPPTALDKLDIPSHSNTEGEAT